MKNFFLRLAFAAAVATIMLTLSYPSRAADTFGASGDHLATAASAPTRGDLWTGLSIEAGFGMTASAVDIGAPGVGTLLTLGDTAWAGHLGIGYDHMISRHLVVGVLARAEINELAYSVAGTKLGDTDIEYTVGARVGWVPRSDWMIYALAGYRFGKLDLAAGFGDTSKNGWVLGGGVEAMMTDNVFVGLEYAAALGDSERVANTPVSLEATEHTGKVRLGYRF